MRKSTLLWLVLAAFCGVALFHTSQKVHDSREKIEALQEAAVQEEETLRVLHAEWSYLNQPERLEKLAKQYLALVPMKGSRFAKAEDFPLRAAAPPVTVAISPPVDIAADIVPATPVPAPEIKPSAPPPTKTIRLPAHRPFFAAATLPHPKPAAPVHSPATASSRSFGDVMKSLGVE